MRSSDSMDKIQRLEQRLIEMQRRTMSTLTVTDPVSGVSMVQIRNGQVILTDQAGFAILWGSKLPRWGYEMPWTNYVAFPSAATGAPLLSETAGVFVDFSTARLRPSSARLKVATLCRVNSVTVGATIDTRCTYSINGGADTVIAASVFSTTSTSSVSNTWDFVWPSDLFSSVVTLRFQGKLSGSFDAVNDSGNLSPYRIYGAPQ